MNSTAHVNDGVCGRMPGMVLRAELERDEDGRRPGARCSRMPGLPVHFRGSSAMPKRGWNSISTVNNPKPKTN